MTDGSVTVALLNRIAVVCLQNPLRHHFPTLCCEYRERAQKQLPSLSHTNRPCSRALPAQVIETLHLSIINQQPGTLASYAPRPGIQKQCCKTPSSRGVGKPR